MCVRIPEIIIDQRKIGEKHPPLIIAEIGINHEGNVKLAKKMVYDAYQSGAECVKFQTHIIKDEMTQEAQKTFPANANESIYDIIKRCSLNSKERMLLKKYVEQLGMIYLSTPFSRAAADELEKMNVKAFKIGSGECNNYPLIEHIAKFGKPIILSTGMNDIISIKKSISIFHENRIPYALLHCTSLYPTPYSKVRLGAINELKKNFSDAVVGLSDHSIGNYTCFAAISLGATILEKHFTSSKNLPGPDIQISIDPYELKDLINGSKAIHQALGGKKTILKDEQPTIDFSNSSVVSIKEIKKGEIFTEENIWVKRPGTGEIRAEYYYNILGKKAIKYIDKDMQLKKDMIANE